MPKKTVTNDDYLAECVRIEPLALQEEFIRLPADFAFWNERYKQALEAYLSSKATLEQTEARMYLTHSASAELSGKKLTVDALRAKVETDDDVMLARQAHIEAEVQMAGVKGTLEAIRTKRDMVIQMGAQVRSEMQHDPLVRNRVENERIARGE